MTSLPRKGRCSRTCREGPGAGPAFLWLPGVRVPPARHSQSARLEPCLQTRVRRERSGCRRRAGRMWVGGSRGPAAAFRGPLGAQGRWSHLPRRYANGSHRTQGRRKHVRSESRPGGTRSASARLLRPGRPHPRPARSALQVPCSIPTRPPSKPWRAKQVETLPSGP